MHFHPIILSVFCSFVNNDTFACGSGVLKLVNSLLLNTEFIKKLKIHIEIVKSNLQKKTFLFWSLKMGTFEIWDTYVLHFFLKEFS